LDSNSIDRSIRDQSLLKKEQKKHLILCRRCKRKKLVNYSR